MGNAIVFDSSLKPIEIAMPKASPIFHASSDDNDEGDFDYGGSPSARADRSRRNVERRPSQRREPVEHDEDIPPSPQVNISN